MANGGLLSWLGRTQPVVGDPELPAAMGPEELSALTAVYAAVAPARVVEWGSGGSTKAMLSRFAGIERYVSVEHNEMWHARVAQRVADSRLELLHRPPADTAPEPEMFEKSGGKVRAEYVAWAERCENEPEILADYVAGPGDGPFDLAFVDGRARVFCIAAGFAALRSGGVLVLHDAQRDAYHSAMRACGDPVFVEPWSRGQICIVRKS